MVSRATQLATVTVDKLVEEAKKARQFACKKVIWVFCWVIIQTHIIICITIKIIFFHNLVVAADCSHCHLPSGLALPVTDGPCKPYSKNSTECVNQAETNYCTTNPSGWNYRCYSAGTVILNNSAYTLQPFYLDFHFTSTSMQRNVLQIFQLVQFPVEMDGIPKLLQEKLMPPQYALTLGTWAQSLNTEVTLVFNAKKSQMVTVDR